MITEIYERYKIPSNLQEHHLRVTAVAQQICDNLTVPVDANTVVRACLIHDMGNIIKFEFDYPDEFYAPQGRDYWRGVQQEYFQKYGHDEHKASLTIAKELGMSEKVLDCIEAVDFKKSLQNVTRGDFEPKICDYADLRVAPYGVVSLKKRLDDGAKRYKNRPERWLGESERGKLVASCFEEERQVFTVCKIRPQDINDQFVAPIIKRLRTYKI